MSATCGRGAVRRRSAGWPVGAASRADAGRARPRHANTPRWRRAELGGLDSIPGRLHRATRSRIAGTVRGAPRRESWTPSHTTVVDDGPVGNSPAGPPVRLTNGSADQSPEWPPLRISNEPRLPVAGLQTASTRSTTALGGPASSNCSKRLQRGSVALGDAADRAIEPVGDPAVEPHVHRLAEDEVAEPDALDAAAHGGVETLGGAPLMRADPASSCRPSSRSRQREGEVIEQELRRHVGREQDRRLDPAGRGTPSRCRDPARRRRPGSRRAGRGRAPSPPGRAGTARCHAPRPSRARAPTPPPCAVPWPGSWSARRPPRRRRSSSGRGLRGDVRGGFRCDRLRCPRPGSRHAARARSTRPDRRSPAPPRRRRPR